MHKTQTKQAAYLGAQALIREQAKADWTEDTQQTRRDNHRYW